MEAPSPLKLFLISLQLQDSVKSEEKFEPKLVHHDRPYFTK
jgi:hypothetical protein